MIEMSRQVGILRYRTRIGTAGDDGILISQTIAQGETGPVHAHRVVLTWGELKTAVESLGAQLKDPQPGPYSGT